MEWWELVLYIFSTMLLIWFVLVLYKSFKKSNAASEKALVDAEIENKEKKRMSDLQTLHKLKKMGLA